MDNIEERLRAKLALLESQIDLMDAEMSHLDLLLRECGFPEGIRTLRMTVEDFIATMPIEKGEASS